MVCVAHFYPVLSICLFNVILLHHVYLFGVTVLELVAQFPVFLSKGDYQTVVHIYQEITEVMIPFQDFFAYPALVNVFNAMSGLFWGSYSIAFGTEEDYVTSVYLLGTLLSYFVLLLAVMLPASAVNKASKVAKNTILCLLDGFLNIKNTEDVYL
ncbi:uncharacterized protein TNCT_445731 [Trichonephila clavata]|uniref:Uncharacterized protein n=1 Tax=Trichonephila clavata TaxID=2740835 RepID=A0A8X6HC88_TRICU|nr:uncharacterized protein TNCT_445731 [Trichonephila clavata]